MTCRLRRWATLRDARHRVAVWLNHFGCVGMRGCVWRGGRERYRWVEAAAVPERRLGQMRGQTGARTRPQPPRAVSPGQLRRVGRSVPKVALLSSHPSSFTPFLHHPALALPSLLLIPLSGSSHSLHHISFPYHLCFFSISVFFSLSLLKGFLNPSTFT